MDSTDAPVSIAVELATLTVSAFRYFAGAFRWGFVAMRGLPFIDVSYVRILYGIGPMGAITKWSRKGARLLCFGRGGKN